jgi:hypothetical protein
MNWKEFDFNKTQKYIIDNDIKTRREFQSSPHRGLYKRARLKGFLKDLKFQKEQTNWSENYKTIEDVQNFIDKENIPNPMYLYNNFRGLHNRCCEKGWIKYLKFSKKQNNWEHIKTIQDAQEFIFKNNIESPKDFRNKYPGLTNLCTTNGWIKDLNYINYTKREKISWKSINSIELMQKFIYDNLITKSELHDKFPGLCTKCYNNGWIKYLKFIKKSVNMKISSWEKSLVSFLQDKLIVNTQLDSYSSYSKIDIFLPNLNIAIEVQGPNHYSKHCRGSFNSFLKTRKSDIKKNRWCREQGITLLYFSYDKLLVEKYGYPWYIYTSEKELLAEIERIKSL